ncbi:hybrid sensor histidine kinase/response regulator [Sandaracinus amylolyticus]|uniref:hybrid sensor histidine kinase/response regulator n=1 Tax=Sandaracinus amylolyticus TaxID=927083 RepID=UPI001F265027|nr:hybrid sensor histidine kinase/response regulator [Sandaracinus amylolyticus]
MFDPSLRGQRIAHAYAQMPGALAGSATVTTLFAITACGTGGSVHLSWWIVLQVLAIAANVAILVAYRRGRFEAHRALWARRWGTLVIGIGWGIGGLVWPMHDEFGTGIAMSFCLAGLAASATSTLAADPTGYAMFAITALGPDVAASAGPRWWTAGLLAAFLCASFFMVWQNAVVLRAALSLRFENAELLARAIEDREAAEEARARAESAATAKTRFLAAASHDLRQPLQALSLFVDVLATEPPVPEARRRGAVDALVRTVHALRAMLEGLLDLSRLDAGIVVAEPQVVSLAPLVGEVIAALHDEADARGVTLSAAGPELDVRADPALLARVAHNLAANAVRHGGRGRVLIATRRRGDRAWLQIFDQGPGIPDEARERIFEEFVQLGNPERDRTKGLGLGLSMVQRICELAGWTLSLRSEVGRGSVFTVELPLATSEPVREPRPSVPPASRALRILLVDDDVLVRQALEGWLEQCGCEVHVAGSAEEALETLRTGCEPDAVVSDLRLPGALSGADLADRIARPLILLTGDVDVPEEHGAAMVLRKPVSGPTLWATLTETIERGANGRQRAV